MNEAVLAAQGANPPAPTYFVEVCKTLSDLEELEEQMADRATRRNLVKQLVDGTKVHQNVQNVMNRVLSDEVTALFTMNGNTGKRAFMRLQLFSVMRGAEKGRVTIVGGTEAAPHSRPYMVSLQEGRLHLCGGILIREDFVLTAAHCNGRYRVVLGAHSLHVAEPTQQILGIKKFFTHPGYIHNQLDNDIMLLKLDGKAKMTPAVQVIPLMTNLLPAGKVCSTTGWGDMDDSGTLPDSLQEVNATILSHGQCIEKWGKLARITKHMVCATGSRRFQGFCSVTQPVFELQ
ncbi:hypothetical protein GJAV_G00073680 [Gymnothorax javanicus]|nr:hypothetical protein GJAV_G00073680 [Gymnothorax javanicus]